MLLQYNREVLHWGNIQKIRKGGRSDIGVSD